jgi:hypothetical protein
LRLQKIAPNFFLTPKPFIDFLLKFGGLFYHGQPGCFRLEIEVWSYALGRS